MISLLQKRLSEKPILFDTIKKIGQMTKKVIDDLENEQFGLDWMTENEALLEELGVVGNKAKEMIRKIEKSGGFAKISGAGGVQEGSGIILASHLDSGAFRKFLTNENWTWQSVHLGIV